MQLMAQGTYPNLLLPIECRHVWTQRNIVIIPQLPWGVSQQEEGLFIFGNQTIPGSTVQIRRYFTMAVFYNMAIKAIKQKVNTSKFINLVVKD